MKETVMLKLEVEGMKRHMIHAFSQKQEEIVAAIQTACDGFLSSGEMEYQIKQAVERTFNFAIDDFFSRGEGRDLIYRQVKEHFKKVVTQV